MNAKAYFGGIPTEPDVNKLRDQFPESSMEPGQVINYEDVEAVIGSEKGSPRFQTVTSRWRRLVERETGRVILGTERGVGFKVLDNRQKLDLSSDRLQQAVKRTRRAYEVTGRIEISQLSEEERDRMLAIQKRSASVIATAQIQRSSELPTLEGRS